MPAITKEEWKQGKKLWMVVVNEKEITTRSVTAWYVVGRVRWSTQLQESRTDEPPLDRLFVSREEAIRKMFELIKIGVDLPNGWSA